MKFVSYSIVIIAWIISIFLMINFGFWYAFAIIFVSHFIEIFTVGIKTGKKNGISVFASSIATLIFGFVWWLPLKKSKESK